MKISENTLAILKNFSSINSSLLVRPGNQITTMAAPVWTEVYDLQGRLLMEGSAENIKILQTGLFVVQYRYANGHRKSVKVLVRIS